MKLAAAILCVMVGRGVARATPIEPLWSTKVGCSWSTTLVEWRDSLAWIEGNNLRRIDRATGRLLPAIKLGTLPPDPSGDKDSPTTWKDYARVELVVGDDIVIHLGHAFAVVNGVTGKVLWRGDQRHPDGGLPRLDLVARDVLWTHPASLGQGDPPVFLERRAVGTGKQLWRGDAVDRSGQVDWVGVDDRRVYLATSPDSIGPKVVLAAFDAGTGKRLWSIDVVSKGGNPGPFLLDDGKILAVVAGEGLRVYDGATGAQRPTVPLPKLTGALRGFLRVRDQLLLADDARFTAIDRDTGRVRWMREEAVGDVFLAHDTLYAWDSDQVRAFDPTDGKELSAYGTAESRVVFSGIGARVPAFVTCDDEHRLSAYDPTGTVQPVERATFTGTLVCQTCTRRERFFAPLEVSAGTATSTTKRDGTFSIAVEGRGAMHLGFDLPPLDAPIGWRGAQRVIHFRGKHRYALGTVRAVKDCGPLEDC